MLTCGRTSQRSVWSGVCEGGMRDVAVIMKCLFLSMNREAWISAVMCV